MYRIGEPGPPRRAGRTASVFFRSAPGGASGSSPTPAYPPTTTAPNATSAWLKASGYLRGLTRAQQFCAIPSNLSAAAQHGRNSFDTLILLAEGRPWLSALS